MFSSRTLEDQDAKRAVPAVRDAYAFQLHFGAMNKGAWESNALMVNKGGRLLPVTCCYHQPCVNQPRVHLPVVDDDNSSELERNL
jgi:hypothetical protein